MSGYKKARKFLCFYESARFFVSLLGFCLFPVEVDMIQWNGCFGNPYKCIYELSVEDVLKQKVCHRPNIFKEGKVAKIYRIIVPKESGPNLHWTTILVNFWEGALNQSIHPTQARMWGRIIFTREYLKSWTNLKLYLGSK